MQHKRKKKTRQRASRTHGYGSAKKHRGAGSRGGRGKAGSGKRGDAKIMKITQGKPRNYLGKHGFKSRKEEKGIVNLASVQEKISGWLEDGLIGKKKDTYLLNLTELGYDKLLSKGNIHVKLNITICAASKGAVNKVRKAGGEISLAEG